MHTTMVKGGSQVPTDNRPHVLLVDTHQDCLLILESLFQERNFRVTSCQDSEGCLAMILEKKQLFDLVVIEARMPGIDGLKLIKLLRQETIIPIILTLHDNEQNVIRKGMDYGACGFFRKPISKDQVRAIDLDVLRAHAAKRVVVVKGDIKQDSDNSPNPTASLSGNCRNPSAADSGSVDSKLCVAKREGDPINGLGRPPNKKPRVIWTDELHAKFVAAVNKFGITKAVPKKILEDMNIPYLTRENVASHLQKYRQHQKKHGGGQQQPSNVAVAQTHSAPDPIPMATLPPLYDEKNVDLYHNAISSFGFGAEEMTPPITQTACNNIVMLPKNDMGYDTDPIIDWTPQIPAIGELSIHSPRGVNQTPTPGGGSSQPPVDYAEEFVPNFDNSLGGYQGGTDGFNNWLGYIDLAWQDPAVNLQATMQPPPPLSLPPPQPSVFGYVPPSVFNQGGYDPTLHGNQFHQQLNQATAGGHFYFPDFPQDKPKFG